MLNKERNVCCIQVCWLSEAVVLMPSCEYKCKYLCLVSVLVFVLMVLPLITRNTCVYVLRRRASPCFAVTCVCVINVNLWALLTLHGSHGIRRYGGVKSIWRSLDVLHDTRFCCLPKPLCICFQANYEYADSEVLKKLQISQTRLRLYAYIIPLIASSL